MYNTNDRFDAAMACAWVRGVSLRTGVPALPDELAAKPVEQLTE